METDTFSQQLNALPHLAKLLVGDATQKVKIAANGRVAVMRAGTWHPESLTLDAAAVRRLADEVHARGKRAFMGPWYLRVFTGGEGLSIFGERRPDSLQHLLAPALQQKLRAAVRTGSLGVVAGAPGAAKCSVLLWLAAQLNGGELVFVSEMPPRALPFDGVTHVYPPSTLRERRELARLLRAHDSVFWNHVDHPDDLRLLLTGLSHASNRWFTLDALDAVDMAHRLKALIAPLGSPYPAYYIWAEQSPTHDAVNITEIVAPGEHHAPSDNEGAAHQWVEPAQPARATEDDPASSGVAAAAIVMPKRARKSGNYHAVDRKPSTGSMPRTHITSALHSVEFLLDLDNENENENAEAEAESHWTPPPSVSAPTPQAHTEIVDGVQIDELLARLESSRAGTTPAIPDLLDAIDLDTLGAAAVRGETAALPPIDLDRIRHLAGKGLWGSLDEPS